MAELAAELGLSRMTVSAVVNGRARQLGLADATARRVREHLARRGYVPSRHARNLRAAPTNVVGILHVDRLYSHLIEAFHRLAEELGASAPGPEIMVTPRERLESAVRELLGRRVTDLVWIHNGSACEDYRNEEIANYLGNARTIVYNYLFDSPLGEDDLLARNFSLVGVARTTHTRRLARFLKKLGHRVIALPDIKPLGSAEYVEAFTGAGLTVADCPAPFDAAKLRGAMARQGVTAACFHGDGPACQAICDLQAAGVRVPEDLTVTGFDGMSKAFNKDLTTLAMPVHDMVAKVRQIVAGEERGLRHCFDLALTKGRTHGPPRRGSFPEKRVTSSR